MCPLYGFTRQYVIRFKNFPGINALAYFGSVVGDDDNKV